MGRERRRREIVEAHGRRKSRVDGEMQRKERRWRWKGMTWSSRREASSWGAWGTILEYREESES